MTRALVIGAGGQLGTALLRSVPAGTELVAAGREVLDITDREAVQRVVGEAEPDIVINAAAYTAVDRAERERDLAMRVNADGAGHVAEAAERIGARLLHVSTDYVFDGTRSTPYRPEDAANPLNVYGEGKFQGERRVAERSAGKALVLRTGWVHSAGGRNFVNTMAGLLREREDVRVVDDQFGTPTAARGLAGALWQLSALDVCGTLHWSDAGVASWYDVAVAIRDILAGQGAGTLAQIQPVPSSEFPTDARRPPFAVLDKTATWSLIGAAPHWRAGLEDVLRS